MGTLDRVGFNAFWFSDLKNDAKVAQCVASLKCIGYKAVEYKLDSFDQAKDWGKEFKRAATITQREGLEVSNFVILRGFATSDKQQREKNVKDVIKAVRACATAGVPMLNTTSGGGSFSRQLNPDDWFRPAIEDEAAAWDNVTGALAKVLKVAEAEGVTVALEPCCGNLVHDFGSTQELFRRVDSPALGLTFDPSHFLIFRNDIPGSIRAFGDRIKHVHMKDAVGRLGEFGKDFIFPIIGEGAIDFPTMLAALDKIGYKGWLSLEFESFKYMADVFKDDPVRAAGISYDSLRALLSK